MTIQETLLTLLNRIREMIDEEIDSLEIERLQNDKWKVIAALTRCK